MSAVFSLVPHPEGPWLLRVDGRSYLLSPDLGRKLEHLAGRFDPERARLVLTEDELVAVRVLLAGEGYHRHRSQGFQGRANRRGAETGHHSSWRRVVWPRLPLLPAPLVESLSRVLRPLATPAVLLAMVGVGAATYATGFALAEAAAPAGAMGTATLVPALILFLLTAVWHELGHAAALLRQGYPPGTVGVGLLVILPVLYCDVTAAAALPRRGRLQVDGAGMAFQLSAGGLLFLLGRGLDVAAWQLAGISALAATLWSLMPFLRADGYWLLCDLLGRTDLESPLAEDELPPSRRAGRLLAMCLILYRVGYTLFLLAAAVWLPWRLLRFIPLREWLWQGEAVRRVLAVAVGLVVVVLVLLLWRNVLGKLIGLVQASWRDGRFFRA